MSIEDQEVITEGLDDSLEALGQITEEVGHLITGLPLSEKLAYIDKFRKKLKAELETLQDIRNVAEELLLSEWELDATTQVKRGGAVIFLKSQKWAKPKDGDRKRVVETLEFLGMHDFVNFNTQSLSSYVRKAKGMGHKDEEDYEVPPALMDVIEVTEVFKIETRS